MELPSYFTDFLSAIRPTNTQRKKMQERHKELRDRLLSDEKLGPLIVSTFIQGSYRRFTANRPPNGSRCDVDVIAVTKMHEDDYTPERALETFRPFLVKHYKGKYQRQGRSWGINVDDDISLDLVPTSAPSEAEKQAMENAKIFEWDFPDIPDLGNALTYNSLILEGTGYQFDLFTKAASVPEWKEQPLRIPDRDANSWDDTHPLEQIRWTWEKSKLTNGHFVNVAKAIKRWRQIMQPTPKYPRSYPLEHMIGDCCPNGIHYVAVGVTEAFEEMERRYRPYVTAGNKPQIWDRGVVGHDVLERISFEDFSAFLNLVKDAADLSRKSLDADTVNESANLWRDLFGDEFPKPPDNGGGSSKGDGGGYTPRVKNTTINEGRFA
ncbi:SMODS domain-containing nucleotidyltransferase [Novipirellula rosea]|uniref:Nucleotidyltransferase n=1 Tax=Novipirellula rosea TaxID=1031540 RepID=A0ABP8M703_9BACT